MIDYVPPNNYNIRESDFMKQLVIENVVDTQIVNTENSDQLRIKVGANHKYNIDFNKPSHLTDEREELLDLMHETAARTNNKGANSVKKALTLHGGDQPLNGTPQSSKHGPKARGMEAARKAAAQRQSSSGKKGSTSQGIFAEAFRGDYKPFQSRRKHGDLPKPQVKFDPMNPGCGGPPKSIIVQSSSRQQPEELHSITFKVDGSQGYITDRKLDHIGSKHAHQWRVDNINEFNTEQANKNLPSHIPKQVRTEMNEQTREEFLENLQEFGDGKLQAFPKLMINDESGRGYLDQNNMFVAVNDKDIIRKAYKAGPTLLEYLADLAKKNNNNNNN